MGYVFQTWCHESIARCILLCVWSLSSSLLRKVGWEDTSLATSLNGINGQILWSKRKRKLASFNDPLGQSILLEESF